jgi:hypothetical protein
MTGYTRQEVFNDGDVILAEHGNNEFDQVEASMAASSGHTHNGASGEGGFIGKLADVTDTQKVEITGTGARITTGLDVVGAITVGTTVDGRDVATDGTKLDTIETNAKDDQTAAEVVSTPAGDLVATDVQAALNELDTEKAALAGAAFTGPITTTSTVDGRAVSTDGTKLDTIETSATADQTDVEIKTAYENNANTNEFSDTEQTKLAGIETAATADQTAAEIKTAYISQPNTFQDADRTKLDGVEASAKDDQTAAEVVFTPTGLITSTDVQAAVAEVSSNIALQIAAKVHHNEVVDVNFAASPLSVLVTNDGNMIQVDTSGGNVILTLPDSSSLSEDMRFSIVKYTADANTITVNRSGTDTINSVSSEVISVQYEHVHFVLDQSDGEWIAAGGLISSIGANQVTVTPTGDISSTNAQLALEELDAEKVSRVDGDKRYSPVFVTVAAMKAVDPVSIDGVVVTITAGMTLHTQGNSSAGDGKGRTYLASGAVLTPDETNDHTLGNGLFAVLQVEDQSTFNTVADLIATLEVKAGIIVHTQRYTTAIEGSGAQYLIKTSVDFGGTPDEKGDHTLDNGNVAVLQNQSGKRNVKQFGATGDGTTDDLASINAAINTTIPTGGRTFFPLGTYSVSGTVLYYPGTTLEGESPFQTSGSKIKLAASSDTDVVRLFSASWPPTNPEHAQMCKIFRLYVDGNRTNQTGANDPVTGLQPMGIHLPRSGNLTSIEEVLVGSCKGSGIMIGDASVPVHMRNIASNNNDRNGYEFSSNSVEAVHMDTCAADANLDNGIFINGASGGNISTFLISNFRSEESSGRQPTGIRINSANGAHVTMVGCKFRSSTGVGGTPTGDAIKVTTTNCRYTIIGSASNGHINALDDTFTGETIVESAHALDFKRNNTNQVFKTPTLQNSWVEFSAGTAPRLTKTIDGMVYLDGAIKSGTTTAGTALFTLDVEDRPEKSLVISVVDNLTALGTVSISPTTGVVAIQSGGNTRLNLDGIQFKSTF